MSIMKFIRGAIADINEKFAKETGGADILAVASNAGRHRVTQAEWVFSKSAVDARIRSGIGLRAFSALLDRGMKEYGTDFLRGVQTYYKDRDGNTVPSIGLLCDLTEQALGEERGGGQTESIDAVFVRELEVAIAAGFDPNKLPNIGAAGQLAMVRVWAKQNNVAQVEVDAGATSGTENDVPF